MGKSLKFKLRQLEAFQAVAEAGHVTRAAKRMGISQPAVSRLISDFSRSVGFELFERRGGVLVPSSEPRYLLGEVNRVLEGLRHLEDLGRDLTERTAGHLRIACLPGFATSHLPGVLSRFLHDRPGVTVTLEPDRPERILEWIVGEQFDCGITDGFAGHPATNSVDLEVRSVCILPKGHPLARRETIVPEDLTHEKLIHTRRDSRFFRRLSKAFADHAVDMPSWIEVRQFTAACTIVAEGAGASVVSALDAEQFRDRLVIRPFLPEIVHRISILRPATGARPLIALDFIDAFVQSLAPFVRDPDDLPAVSGL